MRRLPHHSSHRPWIRPGRGPFAPLLVLLAAVVVAGGIAVVMTLLAILPLLLAGVVAVAVVSAHRRMWSSRRHPVTGPGSGPVAAPPSRTRVAQPAGGPGSRGPDWSASRDRFARLRTEYAQFECDPLAVLRLPALTDVSVPSTARFVDAFAEAQALDTDAEPPPQHRVRFAAAVDGAWRAWHAALDAAERIRLTGIPAEERSTVQRAIKLLTMARDSDNEAERAAAYSRARAELVKLDRKGTLRLPPTAAAAVDAGARGQLPPAPATP